MADPIELFAALAEGVATCSALAGDRPVRDIQGTDVTDALLEHPDKGLERFEWALVEMRNRLADGRATGGFPIVDEDIARVRRLRTLASTGPFDDACSAAAKCVTWWNSIVRSAPSP